MQSNARRVDSHNNGLNGSEILVPTLKVSSQNFLDPKKIFSSEKFSSLFRSLASSQKSEWVADSDFCEGSLTPRGEFFEENFPSFNPYVIQNRKKDLETGKGEFYYIFLKKIISSPYQLGTISISCS